MFEWDKKIGFLKYRTHVVDIRPKKKCSRHDINSLEHKCTLKFFYLINDLFS